MKYIGVEKSPALHIGNTNTKQRWNGTPKGSFPNQTVSNKVRLVALARLKPDEKNKLG